MNPVLVKILNENISCFDAYKCASEKIENENFQFFISSYSQNKIKFTEEIRQVIDEETYNVYLSNIIVYPKFETIRNNNELVDWEILEECTRIEKQIIADYDEVIEGKAIDSKLLNIIFKQRQIMAAAVKTLLSLAFVIQAKLTTQPFSFSKITRCE